MEEKFFTSTSNFFKWVTEVADKGGLKILTLGTHNDTYWVKYEVKVIAAQPDVNGELPSDYEPYFGWCDVDGCEREGCSGGMAWRDTGYWTVCDKHSQMYREGEEQPKMKQTAIDKEKTRRPDGTLP